MENREFYEVLKELSFFMGPTKLGGRSIPPFNYELYKYGMPEESLTEYSDKYDYKRLFLSWYYELCCDNEEVDFDGRSYTSPYSKELERKATDILSKKETLKKYIVYVSSRSNYDELRKKYNLL